MIEQQAEKKGFIKRALMALVNVTIRWFEWYGAGISHPETMMLFDYTGMGMEEAMTYQSISNIKLN